VKILDRLDRNRTARLADIHSLPASRETPKIVDPESGGAVRDFVARAVFTTTTESSDPNGERHRSVTSATQFGIGTEGKPTRSSLVQNGCVLEPEVEAGVPVDEDRGLFRIVSAGVL